MKKLLLLMFLLLILATTSQLKAQDTVSIFLDPSTVQPLDTDYISLNSSGVVIRYWANLPNEVLFSAIDNPSGWEGNFFYNYNDNTSNLLLNVPMNQDTSENIVLSIWETDTIQHNTWRKIIFQKTLFIKNIIQEFDVNSIFSDNNTIFFDVLGRQQDRPLDGLYLMINKKMNFNTKIFIRDGKIIGHSLE